VTPRRAQLLLGAALAALALSGPASAATLTRPEASLLRELNRVRAGNGLGTLRSDVTLQRAARAHSAAMLRTGTFSHGDFALRMRRFGVRGAYAGENLAWGIGTRASARAIVAEWLASPAHRANLLRPGFQRIGLGRAVGTFAGYAGAAVVTADFAGT
jgi:uncharacterized protein YkwD